MRRSLTLLAAAGLTAALAGCGGDQKVPAVGTLHLDDRPLTPAVLTFHPADGTPGPGGFASTDAGGNFRVLDPQGGPGIHAGEYKVTVLRLPARQPKDEQDAVLVALATTTPLPAVYSDPEKTVLTATVESADKPIDLRLTSKK